jgi:hypothetical protein
MNKFERARQELDAILADLMTDKKMRESDKLLLAHNEEWRKKISETLSGKSLEELLGKERAAAGKEARRQANYQQDYTSRGKKIAETRRARGSYDGRSMLGKEHKESTKETMRIKAQIRQDLKRQLGLGRDDKIPQELLEKEYKKRNLV